MNRFISLSILAVLPTFVPIGDHGPPKILRIRFVWIAPGTFLMGSPDEEDGRSADETQHEVTLSKGFYMAVHPVTQEQWQEVMGYNRSCFRGESNLPAEMVSWDECQEFIKRVRARDNKPYRLPTEAEWEFACRAGTTTPYYFGATIATHLANYNGNRAYGDCPKGVFRDRTTPVGSFPANAWGLYDMHGNVSQWCQDWFGAYRLNGVDPQGPDNGKERVLRGGPWLFGPQRCRSANRYKCDPDTRSQVNGFRICFFAE